MTIFFYFFILLNYLEEFRTSTQPVPQPFYIHCMSWQHNLLNIAQSEEQNTQTDEILTIMTHPRL
jgi:hypothetical protein